MASQEMATHSPAGDAPPRTNDAEQPSSRPLSGPGFSRQARRLQLRNAGFRGAAVPPRKVTPKSQPSSNWSSTNAANGSSDVENVSPSGKAANSATMQQSRSSGVLQEIGNSTGSRLRKARLRVSTGKLFRTDTPTYEELDDSMPLLSPPPPKSTIRPRAVKMKAKFTQKRRSASAEANRYIEHLEGELAAAHSQLSSVTSPSVTREQNFKMRNLHAETRQLQEDLAEWEEKYEHRVQEEVDKHCAIEASLRSRIRNLEDGAEETRLRMQELEWEVQTTTESLQAVEAANVDLEKRIEIMSDLLAASPTRIDLHTDTPGRGKKHTRPHSMLPRFPTASLLLGSAERQRPPTQPNSPMLSFTPYHSLSVTNSPRPSFAALDMNHDASEVMSEVESVFSEAPASGDSVTSAETYDIGISNASANPWSLPPPPPNTRPRPARRMRRFGAGSLGPKPLILPSNARYDQAALPTAPPLERSETTPAFFPSPAPANESCDDAKAAVPGGRRRASTTADVVTMAKLAAEPLLSVPQPVDEDGDSSMLGFDSPASVQSEMTTRHFSGCAAEGGRNLLEELSAARSRDSGGSTTEASADTGSESRAEEEAPPPIFTGHDTTTAAPDPPDQPGPNNPLATTALALPSTSQLPTPRSQSRSRSTSNASISSASFFARLRLLFSDLWRSPVALARHVVQRAEARMRIPSPLASVQWWLVGVLLGPMAKRRLLSSTSRSALPSRCCTREEGALLSPSQAPDGGGSGEHIGYGTMHDSRSVTPASKTGTGRRRVGIGTSKEMCCAHHHRLKHSPWLWIKFSITLAFAVGAAFKDGPGSLLRRGVCACREGRER